MRELPSKPFGSEGAGPVGRTYDRQPLSSSIMQNCLADLSLKQDLRLRETSRFWRFKNGLQLSKVGRAKI